jgi:hypothetical protein
VQSSVVGAAEPGEGIWRGSMASDLEAGGRDVVGLIDGWGRIRLMTEQGQYVGGIYRDSDRPNTNIRSTRLIGITLADFTWPDGSVVTDFSLRGTMSPTTIAGEYEGGGDSGRIELSFDEGSSRQLGVQATEGLWNVRDESQNVTATFRFTSGSIYGSDVDGCVYSGHVLKDTIGTSVFLFGIDLNVDNCAPIAGRERNGEYSGHGGLTDLEPGSDSADLFFIAVNNETSAVNLELERL